MERAPLLAPAAAAKAVAQGSGQPLARDVRTPAEQAFGLDLSNVRIHVDEAVANQLDATAFTVGDHVAFAPGSYQPYTSAGRELLGHELVHVAQNRLGRPSNEISEPGDASEREADANADRFLRGEPAHVTMAPSGLVARKPSDKAAKYAPGDYVVATQSFALMDKLGGEKGQKLVKQIAKGDVLKVEGEPEHGGGLAFTLVALKSGSSEEELDPHGNRQVGVASTAWISATTPPTPKEDAPAELDAEEQEIVKRATEQADREMEDPQTPSTSTADTDPFEGEAPLFGLDASPDAFKGMELQSWITPDRMPKNIARSGPPIAAGPYKVYANVGRDADGKYSIKYFVAFRVERGAIGPTNWTEWIVGPDSIETFIANVRVYANAGSFEYRFGPPSAVQATSDQFLRSPSLKTAGEAWKTAATDPGWWISILAPLAGGVGIAGELEGTAAKASGALESAASTAGTELEGAGAKVIPIRPNAPVDPAPPTVAYNSGSSAATKLDPLPASDPHAIVMDQLPTPANDVVPHAPPQTAPVAAAPKQTPNVNVSGLPASLAGKAVSKPSSGSSKAKVIVWPPPLWAAKPIGDSGSLSPVYNKPAPPLVTKQKSPPRDRTQVGLYVGRNIKTLKTYYPKSGSLGDIHHKQPLYLGGPDTANNMVFLLRDAHRVWHGMLSPQTNDPDGTSYAVI